MSGSISILPAMGRSRRTGGLADPAGSVEADVADALALARPFRRPCPANQAFSAPHFFSVQVATKSISLKTAVDRREAAGFCDFARCGCIRLARAAGAPEARGH